MDFLKVSIPEARARILFVVRVLSIILMSGAFIAWWAALSAVLTPGMNISDGNAVSFAFLGGAFFALALGLRLMHKWVVVAYGVSSVLLVVASVARYGISPGNFPDAMVVYISFLAVVFGLFLFGHHSKFK